MTAPDPALTDIIAWLIRQPTPTKKALPRGLHLAYTPPGEDGRARLSLSRLKQYPSDNEMYIVKRDLQVALTAAGLNWGNMITEPWQRKGRWWFHVIEWTEWKQVSLL